MIDYIDLDKTESYKKLLALAPIGRAFDFRACLNKDRINRYQADTGGGLRYCYAAKAVDDVVLRVLEELSAEQKLLEKYQSLREGDLMNTGERRLVLHQLLRGGGPLIHDGRDIAQFYAEQLSAYCRFADAVRSGAARGSSGKEFTTVAQIGIGGSDLGPRALYLALEGWGKAAGLKRLNAEFIANVDPDDAAALLDRVDLERTLFVLVSKSGGTQETLANESLVRSALAKAGLDPAKHFVAVTSETSPLARNPAYRESFYIDDYIGGRYSATSAVGGVLLSIVFGPDAFRRLLAGARAADLAATRPFSENAALIDALVGVWERNVLGYPATAVLPYSQALSRFPAHLQQLDMESNGKSVNRRGEGLKYPTGPLVFGEPGTNGQHSFYQLLHQGTDIIPLQFIGFAENQRNYDLVIDDSTSQAKLNANLAAQIVAFAKGKNDANPNKRFAGGRPSSLLWARVLEPESLGALLAHFENKVMFQGFAWNLNSFDQEGVQLGKLLAKKVLSGDSEDSALAAYADLLGVK